MNAPNRMINPLAHGQQSAKGNPYAYSLLFSGLAATAQTQQSFQVEAGFNFYWTKAAYFADIAAAAQTDSTRVIPLVTVQIVSSFGSDNNFSAAVPVSTVFGEGNRPFVLPAPRVYPANSSITVTVTNFSLATTYNLRLVLLGVKVPVGVA